jgi:antibiotic biosynthesis monooxygenase (ABM) superfamily enzyme
MSSSPTDTPSPKLEVRTGRASSVIVHRVPAQMADRFMEWEREVTRAAEGFAGYQSTDVYPPANGTLEEWVVVIHFDTSEALQRWIDSPVRSEWTDKFRREIGEFRLKMLPSGFGSWFAGQCP